MGSRPTAISRQGLILSDSSSDCNPRSPLITTCHSAGNGYSSSADTAKLCRSAMEEVDRMMSCLGNALSVPKTIPVPVRTSIPVEPTAPPLR